MSHRFNFLHPTSFLLSIILSLFFTSLNSKEPNDQTFLTTEENGALQKSINSQLINTDDDDFSTQLDLIRNAVSTPNSKCFISYAWEQDKQHSHHTFAKKLCDDLKKAGLSTNIDVNDLLPGEIIEDYIKKIDLDDYFVIVLLTPTYKKKQEILNSWIFKEVSLITNRFQRNQKNKLENASFFYIPLLIEGAINDSLPDCLNILDSERLYIDFQEGTYSDNFLRMLRQKLLHPQKLLPRQWISIVGNLLDFSVPQFKKIFFIESKGNEQEATYLTQLWKILNPKQTDSVGGQSCALTGMGGIGKTQLALAYANEAKRFFAYDVIHWVYSERLESIHQSYVDLLVSLKSNFPENQLSTFDIRQLVNELRTQLARKSTKWLLIYDNVPAFTDIAGLLPSCDGHILITSRSQTGWDQQQVNLEVFTEEEAIHYLLQKMGLRDSASHEQRSLALALVRELGFLPLALSHAASYMEVNRLGGDFKAYLSKLQTSAAKLFLYHPNKKLKDLSQLYAHSITETERKKYYEEIRSYVDKTQEYPFSVGLTWNVTKEMLSPLSQYIFSHLSYCDPDKISLDELKFLVFPENDHLFIDSELFTESICELSNYSLISYNRDTGIASMHRLLQKAELYFAINASSTTNSLNTTKILENLIYSWLKFIEDEEKNLKSKTKEELSQSYSHLSSLIAHITNVEKHLENTKQSCIKNTEYDVEINGLFLEGLKQKRLTVLRKISSRLEKLYENQIIDKNIDL